MTAGGMKMAGRGRVVRRGGVSGCLSVRLSVLRGFAELEAAAALVLRDFRHKQAVGRKRCGLF